MQYLPRRRGNLCPHYFLLQTVVFSIISLLIPVAKAQDNSSFCSADQQPVITSVNPPSGSDQTTYAVSGENLNETRSILVIREGTDILQAVMDDTAEGFSFEVSMVNSAAPATLILVPEQDGCINATVELYILPIGIANHNLGEISIMSYYIYFFL